MIKYIISIGLFFFLVNASIGQTEKMDKIKSIELRSNSRDITPVRKTNLHKPLDIRKNNAINNAKRQELRQKRAMYRQKKLMQNRKRMQQMQQMMRKKAVMQRNRR